MPAVPERFPFRLSDDELDATLAEMVDDIAGYPDFHRLLPELKLAILQAGIQERSRRETERLRRSTDAAAARALLVSLVALVVAVASLAIAFLR